jgi:hypothetical protein
MKNYNAILVTCLLCVAALTAISMKSFEQQPKFEYLEIEFNFGLNRGVSFFTFSEEYEEDLKGFKFKSTSEALSHLGNVGWELVDVYPTEHSRSIAKNAYVLKRVLAE